MGRTYRPYNPEAHKRRKYITYLKTQGVLPYISDEPVRAHIAKLRERLTIEEIATRAGVPDGTVQSHTPNGANASGEIRPENARAILSVRVGPGDLSPAERLLGAQRMLQGLMRAGFNTQTTAEAMELRSAFSPQRVNSLPNILQGSYTPGAEVYARLLRVAQKFETVNPMDLGQSQRSVNSVKYRGVRFAPLSAWDYDTIHLPESLPDWTGECGSVQGYRIHKREKIPVCEACRVASVEYEKERRRAKASAR